jgi:integrase/recombinase XerD
MSNIDYELIAELRVVLTRQRYSPVVAGNYCTYAREFVDYLARQGIEITDVISYMTNRQRRPLKK